MSSGKFDPIGDAFKYGPKKALSLLNSKLKNDKTISNYLANKKYNTLAKVARTLGYGKRPKRRIKGGGDFMEYVLNRMQQQSGMTREEAKRYAAKDTGNSDWLDDSHTDRTNHNPFAALTNGRNWDIAGSIGKSVIGDVIVPVVTGGFVNPLDVAKIVVNGVKKVNGKGSGRRRGGCKCGGRKIAAQRSGGRKIFVESPYNKGLLN